MANVTVECMRCHQPVTAPIPAQEIVNRPNTSVLVLEHPERFSCPTCGTELTLAVVQAQFVLAALPAPPKPSGLILAG